MIAHDGLVCMSLKRHVSHLVIFLSYLTRGVTPDSKKKCNFNASTGFNFNASSQGLDLALANLLMQAIFSKISPIILACYFSK